MQKKEKTQIIATLILSLIFLLLVIYNLTSKKKSSLISVQNETPEKEAVLEAPQAQGLSAKLNEEGKRFFLKRDPFSTTIIRTFQSSVYNLELGGIVWDREKPTTIINGRILEIGDKIDNATVIDIRVDRVILSDDNHTFELLLGR